MIVAYLVLTALGIFTELVTMDNGTVHSRDITLEWIVFNRAKLVDIFSKRRLGKYEYIHEMQSSAPIRHFVNYLAQNFCFMTSPNARMSPKHAPLSEMLNKVNDLAHNLQDQDLRDHHRRAKDAR
jgi:hypothetical protein